MAYSINSALWCEQKDDLNTAQVSVANYHTCCSFCDYPPHYTYFQGLTDTSCLDVRLPGQVKFSFFPTLYFWIFAPATPTFAVFLILVS